MVTGNYGSRAQDCACAGGIVHLGPCTPLTQVFKSRTPPEAIALCSSLLEYTPSSRLSPLEACAHSFFDELRCLGTQLPNNRPLPPLFNFSPAGEKTVGDVGGCGGAAGDWGHLVWKLGLGSPAAVQGRCGYLGCGTGFRAGPPLGIL